MYLIRCEAKLALGDFRIPEVELALNILGKSSNYQLFALAKFFKARIHINSGEYLEAQENLTEAYVYHKRIEDFRGMGRVSNLQSFIAFKQSDFASFRRYAEQSIKCYSRSDNFEQMGVVHSNLALGEFRLGRLQSALKSFKKIEKSYYDILSDSHKYNFYHIGALIYSQLNCISEAQKLLNLAKKLPEDLRLERCQHFEISGYVNLLANQPVTALELLNECIRLTDRLPKPDKALYSQTYRLLGDVNIVTREWKAAQKFANDALKIATEINERLEIAACYRILAQVARYNRDEDKARENFKQAIDLFTKIEAAYELAVTRYLAATSDLYDKGERNAMLYLARDYFVSEGVHHYVEKVDEVIQGIPAQAQPKAAGRNGAPRIIAVSDKMKKILELAEHVASSEMTVLLTGPTGTGKDLLARYVHCYSGRKGDFVSVNSAAIPHDMIESELFGYKKGAFTGAVEDRPGLFEQANEGTFYLNEIADATPAFQAKLLEVLETRQIRRLGENKMRLASFRLIAATNHDLVKRIGENKFRADLYHRLKQIPIQLPSLRERPEDIEPLVDYFLKKQGYDGPTTEIGQALAKNSWPGNIRELEAEVRQLWLLSRGQVAKMLELLSHNGHEIERDKLFSMLNTTGWNRREAARILNISEATVRYRIKKFGLLEPISN